MCDCIAYYSEAANIMPHLPQYHIKLHVFSTDPVDGIITSYSFHFYTASITPAHMYSAYTCMYMYV